MTIPVTIDAITPELLSEALGATVTAVTAERIAVGEGFLGELARLTLAYADGEVGPATVIAKIPTTDAGMKPLGMMLNVYERESRAYEEVVPGLQVRVPKAFYNGADSGSELYCLILEDIGHLAGGDHHAGATIAQAESAVRAAAGIHGRWWDRMDGFEWIPPIDSPLNMGLQDMYEQAFPMIADRFGDLLGAQLLGHIERFIPTCTDLLVAYGENSRTLVHGDFRLDNMFFDGDELVLIDWQIISRGDGMADLCPFLSCNLTSEMRRSHETELLRLYHRTITEMGAGFSHFDDLVTGYRLSLNFWLTNWCFGAVSAGETTTRGEELFERMVARTADAVTEHESWELIGEYDWLPRP